MEKTKNIKNHIKKLRESKITYEKIGKLVGCSKQRIHQILTSYQSPSNKYPKTKQPFFYINPSTGEKYDTEGIKLEGRDWLKEVVRRRDNHTCQSCHTKWLEGERRLDVYNLDPKIEGKDRLMYCNCKNFDRMISLCHPCCLNLKHVRENMSKGHKTITNK